MRLVDYQYRTRHVRRAMLLVALVMLAEGAAPVGPEPLKVLKVRSEPPMPMADGLVLEGTGDLSAGLDRWSLPPGLWARAGADGATVEAELYWDDPSVVLVMRGLRGGQEVESVSRTPDYAPTTYRRVQYIDTRVDEFRIRFGETESATDKVSYDLRCVIRRAEPADTGDFDVMPLGLGQWMDGKSLSQNADHWWAVSAQEGESLSSLRFPNAAIVVALKPLGDTSLTTNTSRYDLRIYDAEWVGGQPRHMRLRKAAVQPGSAAARPPVCVMPLEDPIAQLTRGGEKGRGLMVRVRLKTSSPSNYKLQAYLVDLGGKTQDRIPGQSAPLATTGVVESPAEILSRPWERRLIGRGKWGTRAHAFDTLYPGTLTVSVQSRDRGTPVGVELSRDGRQAERPNTNDWSWTVGLESPVVVQVSALAGPTDYTLEDHLLPAPDWGRLAGKPQKPGQLRLSYGATWRGWAQLPSAGGLPEEREVTVVWDTGAAMVDVDLYSRAEGSQGDEYEYEQRATVSGSGEDSRGGVVALPYSADAGREYIAHVALNSRTVKETTYTIQHRAGRATGKTAMRRGVLQRPDAAGTTFLVHETGPGIITLHVLTSEGSAEDQDRIRIYRAGEQVAVPVRTLDVNGAGVTQYVLRVSSVGTDYDAVVNAEGLALYYTWRPDGARAWYGGGNNRADTAERAILPAGGSAMLKGRVGSRGDRRDVWRVRLPQRSTVAIQPPSEVDVDVLDGRGRIAKRLDTDHPSMERKEAGVVYLVIGPATTGSIPDDGSPYAIQVADQPNGGVTSVFVESFVDYN